MNVKLTLSLDAEAIERGKRFAREQNTSLSQLVQTYFIMLDDPKIEVVPVSPKLQKLVGIGSGAYDENDCLERLVEKNR